MSSQNSTLVAPQPAQPAPKPRTLIDKANPGVTVRLPG